MYTHALKKYIYNFISDVVKNFQINEKQLYFLNYKKYKENYSCCVTDTCNACGYKEEKKTILDFLRRSHCGWLWV